MSRLPPSRMRKVRAFLSERDGYRCAICGGEFGKDAIASIDHIIPLSRGGTNARDNLRLAHRGCNSRRGAPKPIHGEWR